MSEIDTHLLDKDVPPAEKKSRLWLAALIIMLVVFVPALIAWGLSAMSSR